MKKKITILVLFFVFFTSISYVKAEEQKTFRIMTESDYGDYVGQNESWDFSNANNSKIKIQQATENTVIFNIEDFSVSDMKFEFAGETGKTISSGLYSPAKRSAFRGSYNGINISGDGRGCNTSSGAFYVHEYVVNNGTLEKAAIDFVQICGSETSDFNQNIAKLFGSVRYNSSFPDSCNNQGCAEVKKNLGITASKISKPSIENTTTTVSTSNNKITNVSDLPKADAYKAIVKINTFTLGENDSLLPYGSGSGVIINSTGLILTNYHVVTVEDDFDNTQRDATYQVCTTESIEKEPNCFYTAKLVARDKDLDIALLKIQNISELSSVTTFSYLSLNPSDTTNINDEVIALGYPGIGGETITITKSIISGKTDKYDKHWIKTDAVISFGSSGGAAIDSKGNVLGITSAGHSDFAGSLGYIISMSSINNWVNANQNKNTQESELLNRLISFTKKSEKLKTSNLFINDTPYFSVTKPADWDFTYDGENHLQIDKQRDDEGGRFRIVATPLPYIATLDDLVPDIKWLTIETGVMSIVTIKEKNLEINGHKGKEVSISATGSQQSFYMFPSQNYLIKVISDYGQDDKDKEIINNILNSLTIGSNKPFSEVKQYSNKNPKFYISTNNDWSIISNNSKESPVNIFNKKNRNVKVNIEVQKIDEETMGTTNESYLEYIKQRIKEANQMGKVLDVTMEVNNTNAHYKLNNELNNVVVDESVIKSISTGEVLAKDREYTIISGDKLIQISINAYTEKDFKETVNSFNQLASNLSLKGFTTPTATIANTTNTASNNQNNDSIIKIKK